MKYILLLFICCSCVSKKQPADPQKTLVSFEQLALLKEPLHESSGLIAINEKLFTHNDSGNCASIYEMATNGNIVNSITFKHLKNRDWEAMTYDKAFVYIGDFGNNLGNRKDLTIYKVAAQDLSNPTAQPLKINFTYALQQDFTPRNKRHEYDLEAMIAINNKLLLFSKDWKTLQSTLYQIDTNTDALQEVKPIQTIPTRCLITDATYNGSNRIVLTGYDSGLQPYIIVLNVINDRITFQERIPLPVSGSQIEAITYYKTDDQIETYYLTSEALNLEVGGEQIQSDGAIYKLGLFKSK